MIFASADDVRHALRLLGDELARRGVYGRVGVVGGAAMLLAYDERQAGTLDVDGIDLDPHSQLIEAAHVVARTLGLPESWLNDRASVYGPRSPHWHTVESFSHPHLHVQAATPEQMLAMKLRSGRPKDREDLSILVRTLEITTVEAALEVADRVFPDEPPLEPRKLALLRAVIDGVGNGGTR